MQSPICPICNKAMVFSKKDTTYSHKNDMKPYERSIYACQTHDTWGTIETPQQQNTDKTQ